MIWNKFFLKLKLLGHNNYIILRSIIMIQSHHFSHLENWSAFSIQDRTTFPLALITSRDSIADVSGGFLHCMSEVQGRNPIYITFLLRLLEGLPVNEVFRTILIVFHHVAIDLLVKSRQEKQLFASLTVQTPLLRYSKMWHKEFCKAKFAYRGGSGSRNQQPHIQPSSLVRQNGRRVDKSIN